MTSLRRYHLASAGSTDDCIVVRLTGDNVVPDGSFVRELVAAFVGSGLEYLAATSPQSRLPYGLGGEVSWWLCCERLICQPSAHMIASMWGRGCFNGRSGIYVAQSGRNVDYGHLRCTIDDLEDYQRVLRLFDGVMDPVQVSSIDLVRKLASLSGEALFHVPYKVIWAPHSQ